ncbi:MAG: SIS domain-containing protein [Verrucomicrobiota bacterium]
MNPHLSRLLQRAPALAPCIEDIQNAFEAMRCSLAAGGKLLICGNGGSGADAEHWAGELLKGFGSKRPIGGELQSKLGEELAGQLQGALPVIPLTGFLGLRTAWQNDCDPDYVYAQLVLAFGKPGDTLVGISTSGNSKNVALALETARKLGLNTVALTGAGGGKAAQLAQMSVRVPSCETYLIQELHLPVYHTLCLMLEDAFFPPAADLL